MRIEERADFLGEYIKNASTGKYGIAAFQRPFVWTKNDVEQFLASVCDQIPIGGFLLWTLDDEQHAGILSKGRIGPVVHDASTRTMVLDGQNRLSSIIWAARLDEAPSQPAYPYSKQELAVWFSGETLVADIEEKRIHFVPDAAARSPKRFPLGRIMAGTMLQLVRSLDVFAEMETAGIVDSDLNWFLDTIPGHFRSKRTTVTEISHASKEEAFDIFMRVCRTGQPMSDEDFDAARRWMAGEQV